MNYKLYLKELLKKANEEAEKGNFLKSEALFEEYLDKKDDYEKLQTKIRA